MEDLYKHHSNSWLRRNRFSKTVYHQPKPSQIPIIPNLTKLNLGSSNPSSNRASISMHVSQDNTSKATQTTGEVQVESDSKIKKNILASKKGAISDIFKEVKKTVRSRFMCPAHRERIVNPSSSEKKKSSWMKKYFNRETSHAGSESSDKDENKEAKSMKTIYVGDIMLTLG